MNPGPNHAPKQLRIGFFSYVLGPGSAAETYRDVSTLFASAERLGFDTAWVAQHHFGSHGGLPSPLVFLSTIAARTERIGLGTAVVTVPFEHPIKIAEDAAVLDALHPGRLELGLGTGFGSDALHSLFGVEPDQRRPLFNDGVDRIRVAFGGDPLTEPTATAAGPTLHPPAPALLDRLWEGPSTLAGVERAAERGSGLLLSRVAIGTGSTPTSEVQIPMVQLHQRITGTAARTSRVALSRTVYPAASRQAAIDAVLPGVQRIIDFQIANGDVAAGLGIEDYLAWNNIHYGTPDDVVTSLKNEPLIDDVTDLICQVQPGNPSLEQTIEVQRLIAEEVGPAFGWSAGH